MIILGSEEEFDESKKIHLCASLFMLGKDLLIVISGIQDHIGAITLAQPYIAHLNPNIKAKNVIIGEEKRVSSSISTLTQFHHRDDQLLSEFARTLSQQMNLVIAVVGGIHIDNITPDDIGTLSKMLGSIQEKIISKIKDKKFLSRLKN